VNVLSWSVLGFGELPRYLRVLHAFERAGERRAYSLVGLALHLGASAAVATALGFAIALVLVAACLVAGRKARDEVSFIVCTATALLATPIIWLHYFALLLVPLAIARPRFSPIWLLPVVLLVCPPTSPSTWQLLLGLSVGAAVVLAALSPPRLSLGRVRHAVLRAASSG
jgi:hypothetical protein